VYVLKRHERPAVTCKEGIADKFAELPFAKPLTSLMTMDDDVVKRTLYDICKYLNLQFGNILEENGAIRRG
jgi:hypothetical protein